MGEDLQINTESSTPFLSEDEERRFDTLMDAAGKTAHEAWGIIESERKKVSTPTETTQNSRQAIADEQKAKFAEISSEATEFNEARARAIEQEAQDRALGVLRDTTTDSNEGSSESGAEDHSLPTAS